MMIFSRGFCIQIAPTVRRTDTIPGLDVEAGHEFLARRGVVAEHAQHPAGDQRHPMLVHAARGHAAMGGLDDDGDALRLHHLVAHVGDLRGHPLLGLLTPDLSVYDSLMLVYS